MRVSKPIMAGLAFALTLAMDPGSAAAVGIDGTGLGSQKPRPVRRLAEGEPTLAPFAHVVFCQTYAAECRPNGDGPKEIALDDDRMRQLRTVNDEVNRAIRPQNDASGPLGDVWSLEPKRGDCEDYAITKRHRLLALGVPGSALRLVTALTRTGEGHAVLVVSTDQGDLVLDNRTKRIAAWTQTGLIYQKIQSAADPRRWFSISGEAVASAE